MAEYLIQGETLTAIADAIRSKTGETETMSPMQFAEKVSALSVGGGDIGLYGDFLQYVAYQIDMEKMELTIYAILWEELYADTGSYDVYIPGTFGSFSVVINTGGVG